MLRRYAILRFVILRHTGVPTPHYDLMIESAPGSPLLTWRVLTPPEAWTRLLTAARLPDHRAAYLNYEGPISAGRGAVRRIDTGNAWLLDAGTPSLVRLEGGIVKGEYRLAEPPANP